jgi:hypothetical protein
MTESALTDRQVKLLQLVAEGAGTWDTLRIDLMLSTRFGPAFRGPVMHDLQGLASMGLVTWDRNTGRFGRWALTPKAQSYLEGER